MNIQLNRTSDVPLYLQLAQGICDCIASGELKPGDRLPTVRALFSETGLSDGTIRHAYEMLAREGTLTLIQGKGTFVSDQAGQSSRETRAMNAIDQMIEELTALGISLREIQMYVDVKLSQRRETMPLISVAAVDCNSEALNEMAVQLSGIHGIELAEYLLEDVRRAPEQLLENFDLVITTQTHFHELRAMMGEQGKKTLGVVLAPDTETMTALARIPAGSRVGIYCRTGRFAQIIKNGVTATPQIMVEGVSSLLAESGAKLKKLLSAVDLLLVAPDYRAYATQNEQEALSEFVREGGSVIPYHHRLDQGSMLYVRQRIQELQDKT